MDVFGQILMVGWMFAAIYHHVRSNYAASASASLLALSLFAFWQATI